MYFILNKAIRFTPETNELCLASDFSNRILISNAACRLLAELIKNSNDISYRDELLQKVWEDYGYISSHNSLYMAVSEIRKSLNALDHSKEVIITVPKVGIKLVADIDKFELVRGSDNMPPTAESPQVEEVQTSANENQFDFLDEPLNDDKEQTCPALLQSDISKKGKPYYRWFFLITIIIIGLSFLLLQHSNKFTINKLEQYVFFQFNSCRVYIINSSAGYNINTLKEKAISTINNNHIDCKGVSKSIYFQDNFVRSGRLNEYTLGVCSRSSGKNTCETIKSLAG
ncbi:winged helix-turn-helix domain-containing protein [Serratia fonticola]